MKNQQSLIILRLIYSWTKRALNNAFAQVLKTSGGRTLTLTPLHLVLASMTPDWADARPHPAGEWQSLPSSYLIIVAVSIIAWHHAYEYGAPINREYIVSVRLLLT
jgi:hypothetical protein